MSRHSQLYGLSPLWSSDCRSLDTCRPCWSKFSVRMEVRSAKTTATARLSDDGSEHRRGGGGNQKAFGCGETSNAEDHYADNKEDKVERSLRRARCADAGISVGAFRQYHLNGVYPTVKCSRRCKIVEAYRSGKLSTVEHRFV